MLEQLSRSLFEAISESEDVHHHLKRLREEGYSLNLLLDCQPEGSEGDDARQSRGVQRSPNPTFRINGEDLAFLKSLGIDPTRRCKTRRRARGRNTGEQPSGSD